MCEEKAPLTFYLVWPMRWQRAAACKSFWGLKSLSMKMTVSAAVRFIPTPPTQRTQVNNARHWWEDVCQSFSEREKGNEIGFLATPYIRCRLQSLVCNSTVLKITQLRIAWEFCLLHRREKSWHSGWSEKRRGSLFTFIICVKAKELLAYKQNFLSTSNLYVAFAVS